MRGAVDKRYWVLWIGLAIIALGLLLTLPPWAYQIEKHFWEVPDEHYPELLWLSAVVVIGIPVTAAGLAIVALPRNRRRPPPTSPRSRGEEQD